MARIEWLARVVPAPPGKPVRAGAAAAQHRASRVARNPRSWSRADVAHVVDVYAQLAASWNEERGSYRPAPLRDALARGGPLPSGPALEVGSGTGLLTPILLAVWPRVVCVDLSPQMLARSRHPWRVRADAACLPVASATFAAVILADGPLMATEVVRVLRDDGVVVWSNALGREAPQYVPATDVIAALEAADGQRRWTARAGEAAWGSWVVLRRATADATTLAVQYLSGEPLPRVGARWDLIDHAGRRRGTVETTRVRIIPLDQVGDDVARDEGEWLTPAATRCPVTALSGRRGARRAPPAPTSSGCASAW